MRKAHNAGSVRIDPSVPVRMVERVLVPGALVWDSELRLSDVGASNDSDSGAKHAFQARETTGESWNSGRLLSLTCARFSFGHSEHAETPF